MTDPRLYVLPRYIYLSPRLIADGVTLEHLAPLLEVALADRHRTYATQGKVTDPEGREIWWSLDVPLDDGPAVSEFYLRCRREDELFDPFEHQRPFWEEPDYKRP